MIYRHVFMLLFAFTCYIPPCAAEPLKQTIRPHTVKQAIEIIKPYWLSEEDVDWMLHNPEYHVSAELHFGLDLKIRNEFGLWGDNKECAWSKRPDGPLYKERDY